MSAPADVLVIGGGVIGTCAAYYLRARGRQVTLLERGEIAAGSSYGNAGLIVPSHSVPLATPGALASGLRWMLDPESPFYIKPRPDLPLLRWLLRFMAACRPGRVRQALPVLRDLTTASAARYAELAALDGLRFGYEPNGSLYVFKTPRGFRHAKEEAHLLAAASIESEALEGEEACHLEPSLRPDLAGALFFPGDAHLNPAEFVRGLARWIEQRGVCIQTGTEVLGFETAGRRVTNIKTTRGDFSADHVVLAAGSWSPGLAHGLRLRLPIQPAKGYSVTIPRPAASPVIPLLLGEARVGITPLGERLRFAGTLEMAGLDLSVNQRRVAAILRSAQAYVTGLDRMEPGEVWSGLRPCTPDGLPIIGPAPSLDNLVVAAGHATIGMTLGPITGELVAQIVCGETPTFDLHPLRPERF